MGYNAIDGQSLVGLDLKHARYQVFQAITYIRKLLTFEFELDSLDYFRMLLCVFPRQFENKLWEWELALDECIEHDAKAPDVHRQGVGLALEYLRGDISARATEFGLRLTVLQNR